MDIAKFAFARGREADIEDEEQSALERKAEEGMRYLLENGVFHVELDSAQYFLLRYSYDIINELVLATKDFREGNYPKPGETYLSLEIFGSYKCFYRHEQGVTFINELDSPIIKDAPIVRLYINRKLVGLSILGKPVINYYDQYLEWFIKNVNSGLNFTF